MSVNSLKLGIVCDNCHKRDFYIQLYPSDFGESAQMIRCHLAYHSWVTESEDRHVCPNCCESLKIGRWEEREKKVTALDE